MGLMQSYWVLWLCMNKTYFIQCLIDRNSPIGDISVIENIVQIFKVIFMFDMCEM